MEARQGREGESFTVRPLDLAEDVGRNAVGTGDSAVDRLFIDACFVSRILGKPLIPAPPRNWGILPHFTFTLLPQLLPPLEVLGHLRRTEIGTYQVLVGQPLRARGG